MNDTVVDAEVSDVVTDQHVYLFRQLRPVGLIMYAMVLLTKTGALCGFACNIDGVCGIDAKGFCSTGFKTNQPKNTEAASKIDYSITRGYYPVNRIAVSGNATFVDQVAAVFG
ncbi:MAG TPA: hypothetical protein PK823_02625 [Novosphingobium sp.]|nr:hypothetical protein [Novosphingobium sp.]